MDRRLLEYYNDELRYIRETAAEFAEANPRVAAWLAPDNLEVADPYVERLLEGFAFLTARIHLKMDAEFPRFTQALLESIYPQYLAPTPSMAIVQFNPRPGDPSLASGFEIPRDSVLRSVPVGRSGTRCEYRTAHPIILYPLEIIEARYFTQDLGVLGLPDHLRARAALRLRLRTTGEMKMNQVRLASLVLHLCGSGTRWRLFEQLAGHCPQILVEEPGPRGPRWRETVQDGLGLIAYEPDHALFPNDPRTFSGHRLLREYFAMPERLLFIELHGLERITPRVQAQELDLIFPTTEPDHVLAGAVRTEDVALFCAPAVNLFPRDCDRIPVTQRYPEYPVIVDRTRANDFEVHQVESVIGYGTSSDMAQRFRPFYEAADTDDGRSGDEAYFATHRVHTAPRGRERGGASRSNYAGSDLLISLVDAAHAPFHQGIRQLAVRAWCTNRDLPLLMPLRSAGGASDFTCDNGAPLESLRCIHGPTPPVPAPREGDTFWRLISHLALNYLSLINTDQQSGAKALREMLRLYIDGRRGHGRQIDGLRSISARPLHRRIPSPGPVVFARGLELTLAMDDSAFEPGEAFALASVLERFLAGYVSINSFVQTVLTTAERGEVMRWPARSGTRHIL